MPLKNKLPLRSLAAAAALACHALAGAGTLSGWAVLPAATFSDGPTSGQFAFTNPASPGNDPPYVGRQPVQGFSGVLAGPGGSLRMLVDNGFGTQGNSADALLRMVAVRPDFRTAAGGSGTVSPADWASGAARTAFDAASRLQLADPDRRLSFKIQADYGRYYNVASNPAVDPAIRAGRWLTGADFDIESVRQDKSGNLWFGDEFGPYLVKTDANGRVLRREIAMPGVFAPQHAAVAGGSAVANLRGSGGLEGLAVNRAGTRLYTLLEGTVSGDPAGSLRIDEFDVQTESFTGRRVLYRLDPQGTAIGDMTAIDDTRFLVIERNGGTATSGTPFKKIFQVDIAQVDAQGFAAKTELVDLMAIADPHDLDRDGSTAFTFPYVTIENVLIVDPRTLLVVNDNNFPGGGGRNPQSDPTEFLLVTLAQPVPEPGSVALLAAGLGAVGWVARRRRVG